MRVFLWKKEQKGGRRSIILLKLLRYLYNKYKKLLIRRIVHSDIDWNLEMLLFTEKSESYVLGM
jgi:hypothetical protein